MADLTGLHDFAEENGFGLTAPLRAEQVRRLAAYWLPNLHFHEDERFHPIALSDVFEMVQDHLDDLTPQAREQWRVALSERVPGAPGLAQSVLHDPTVLARRDGFAFQSQRKVSRPLADGATTRDAMDAPEVDDETYVTNGASFTFANEHFGSTRLLSGGNTAVPGNPWIPRADERDPGGGPDDRRPRMTVLAQYVNLVDVLRYELLIERAEAEGRRYPPDAMRRAFDIAGWILSHDPQTDPTTPPPTPREIDKTRRDLLLEMIEAEASGGALPDPPPGWTRHEQTWRAVTDHAFLEYSFFYAYNDFERWQTAIFDNEHEGDDEGCCLVFHRRDVNAAAGGDIRTVRPRAIITSVHEEFQDADLFRRIPAPASPGPLARDGVELDVYIAGGSHATYLDPGTHDLVDYGDYWGFVDENDLWVLAPLVLPISIILAILEHFIDTEDFTSADGVHGGPGSDPDSDPAAVATHTFTLAMSADAHVYDGAHDDILVLRSFPGKWGGHDGTVDKSPGFPPKTKRFLREFLQNL